MKHIKAIAVLVALLAASSIAGALGFVPLIQRAGWRSVAASGGNPYKAEVCTVGSGASGQVCYSQGYSHTNTDPGHKRRRYYQDSVAWTFASGVNATAATAAAVLVADANGYEFRPSTSGEHTGASDLIIGQNNNLSGAVTSANPAWGNFFTMTCTASAATTESTLDVEGEVVGSTTVLGNVELCMQVTVNVDVDSFEGWLTYMSADLAHKQWAVKALYANIMGAIVGLPMKADNPMCAANNDTINIACFTTESWLHRTCNGKGMRTRVTLENILLGTPGTTGIVDVKCGSNNGIGARLDAATGTRLYGACEPGAPCYRPNDTYMRIYFAAPDIQVGLPVGTGHMLSVMAQAGASNACYWLNELGWDCELVDNALVADVIITRSSVAAGVPSLITPSDRVEVFAGNVSGSGLAKTYQTCEIRTSKSALELAFYEYLNLEGSTSGMQYQYAANVIAQGVLRCAGMARDTTQPDSNVMQVPNVWWYGNWALMNTTQRETLALFQDFVQN